jgi:hypothetical protein
MPWFRNLAIFALIAPERLTAAPACVSAPGARRQCHVGAYERVAVAQAASGRENVGGERW